MRGALFYELKEIIFCYAELLENLIKKPASDLAIAMNWDCSCPAIWMLPSGVASLLPYHLEAQLSGNLDWQRLLGLWPQNRNSRLCLQDEPDHDTIS